MTGAVTDESGASVPGATMTLNEIGTNAPTVVETTEDGLYTATNLILLARHVRPRRGAASARDEPTV